MPADDAAVPRSAATATRRSPRTVRANAEPVIRPVGLTRAQEYAFIESDMRRLFVVSGILLVLMILILLVAGVNA